MDLFSGLSDELRLALIVLSIINLFGFAVVLWDKSKREQSSEDHVPYPILILTALSGGTLGIIIALKIFHYSFKSNAQTLILVAAVLAQIYFLSQYKDWIFYNM